MALQVILNKDGSPSSIPVCPTWGNFLVPCQKSPFLGHDADPRHRRGPAAGEAQKQAPGGLESGLRRK